MITGWEDRGAPRPGRGGTGAQRRFALALNPRRRCSRRPERRVWLLATGAAGGAAAVATAVPFVSTFAPSERAKAMGAAVEVDIATSRPVA
jgi:hypothetical protein